MNCKSQQCCQTTFLLYLLDINYTSNTLRPIFPTNLKRNYFEFLKRLPRDQNAFEQITPTEKII